MKKSLLLGGNQCYIQEETLSDDSKVFNVNLHTLNDARVSFACASYLKAEKLYNLIEEFCNIDVIPSKVNEHLRQKIESLLDQIAHADEVNNVLRAKNQALLDSLYAMWQKKEKEIMENEDIVTRKDNEIKSLETMRKQSEERIAELQTSIGKLSARAESAEYQLRKNETETERIIKERDRAREEFIEVVRELEDK